MKQGIINLYEFKELDKETQKKVIQNNHGINTDYEWYDHIYSEAGELGFEIEEFDIYRRTCTNKFTDNPMDVADEIIKNHGDMCDTYKTAKTFITDYNKGLKEYGEKLNESVVEPFDDLQIEDEFLSSCAYDSLVKTFKLSLQKNYLKMLSEEYRYLTSEAAIIETIETNEYWFTKTGKIFRE
jgi:hypothetical protein